MPYEELELELKGWKKVDLINLFYFIFPDSILKPTCKEDIIEDLVNYIIASAEYDIEDNLDHFDQMNDDVRAFTIDQPYAVDDIERSAFAATSLFFKNHQELFDLDLERTGPFSLDVDYLEEDNAEFNGETCAEYGSYQPPIDPEMLQYKVNHKFIPTEEQITNRKQVSSLRQQMKQHNLEQYMDFNFVETDLFSLYYNDEVYQKERELEFRNKLPNCTNPNSTFFSELDFNITNKNKLDVFRNIVYDIARHNLKLQHNYNYFFRRFKNYNRQIYNRSDYHALETNTIYKVCFIPYGSGKSRLKEKYPDKYIELDELIDLKFEYRLIYQKIYHHAFLNDNFSLLHYFTNYLVYLNRYRIKDKILLCHSVFEICYALTRRHQISVLSKTVGRKTMSKMSYQDLKKSKFYFRLDYNLYHLFISYYFKIFEKIKKKRKWDSQIPTFFLTHDQCPEVQVFKTNKKF